jgi:uncharacterized membrane protein YgcG
VEIFAYLLGVLPTIVLVFLGSYFIVNWHHKVNAQKQSVGSVLLKHPLVQILLVSGSCILLYWITFSGIWLFIALFYFMVMLYIANRRAGGSRGTSKGNGPAASGPNSLGDGDGGGNGGGNGGGGGD